VLGALACAVNHREESMEERGAWQGGEDSTSRAGITKESLPRGGTKNGGEKKLGSYFLLVNGGAGIREPVKG